MVKNYTHTLNEGFSSYFKKLEESVQTIYDEYRNMTKEPIIEFPNGSYLYVVVDPDSKSMYAGSATNTGIFREYEIEIDEDESFDSNLNALYDYIIEESPEFLEDGEELDAYYDDLMSESCHGKKCNKNKLTESFPISNEYYVADVKYEDTSSKVSVWENDNDGYYYWVDDWGISEKGFNSVEDAIEDYIKSFETEWDTFNLQQKYNYLGESCKSKKGRKKLKESTEKFIITKVGNNTYALAQGNPPVVNSRKTVEASSPEEAKKILMNYGYSEDELIVESLNESLEDYPGAKKIDAIKGIAIDTDRVQSEEAEDKYGFYQGDIIFGDEHLEVGGEYTIDVYEIPEEDWDEEGTGFGIGRDNPYFMVLKNKIEESLNESFQSNLNHDIYEAIGDICWEYISKDREPTKEELEQAISYFFEKWF